MIKECPSYPGYSATDDCRVISHRLRGKGKQRGSVSIIDMSFSYELKQFCTPKGYFTVSISFESGKARPVGVHQLVADAYHGPCPEGMQVRHLNDIPDDNRPENLAYGTIADNAADRFKNGNYAAGGKHFKSKLTDFQASEIRELRKQGLKVKQLAEKYMVSLSTIESIIYLKSYKTIEFERMEAK
ncbi:HNH endonuclease [Yersinia enterocolitica]|uniref:HNH endonuclease n=1 Tax=Yersinia enterocolitica TaxID=630 RepID=UPI002FE790A1|nr:HNH endonuclease [Yersinia enterocolitica]HDL6770605.1 HNH endonuclease [Yersinia enterocolitica]HDL7128092.1 HNH endonuclease [Yersinia enterocolitica]HDL7946827.1 HNH endonuclease [Yersinia enterocolitica]HDL7955747.1 HNH endonuclease [Yersinia enterocolitica]